MVLQQACTEATRTLEGEWALQEPSLGTTVSISASCGQRFELCEHLCFVSISFVPLLASSDLRYQKGPENGYFLGLETLSFFPHVKELYLLCFMPFQLLKGFQGAPYFQMGDLC